MGLIFDRFGTKSDERQLKNLLARNVRMLSQLAVCPLVRDSATAASQISRLRSQINENFASLGSQMEAARFEFEFRRRREEDIAECVRIQRVQPGLRSVFLLELSLQSHRARPKVDSELTRQQTQALDEFLEEYSDGLRHIAAWISQEEQTPAPFKEDSIRQLQQSFENHSSPNAEAIVDICQKMVSSLHMVRNEC
jgi:hypothetical protein